jgi:hypothetical protein
MPAYARADIIDEYSVGTYHCINRCVRRAYLCGQDIVSGKNYEHRKAWLEKRLAKLAKIFAIKVSSHVIMDNHLHVVLTNRPDIVRGWDANELIDRWWQLYPRDNKEVIPEQLRQAWLVDFEHMTKISKRLSSISWFMKCLVEPLARIANREDGATGRFWQGRFSSIKVLDQRAALETAIYVDLNPIKAGKCTTLEESDYTSIAARIAALIKGAPLDFVLPIKEVMRQFVHEAPYLLEEESDYVEIVRLRAEELLKKRKEACEANSFVASCPTAIGSPALLQEEATRLGRKWLKGKRLARIIY